jgi:hypothetical protein
MEGSIRVVRLIPDDSGFGLGNSGFNFGSDYNFGSTQYIESAAVTPRHFIDVA